MAGAEAGACGLGAPAHADVASAARSGCRRVDGLSVNCAWGRCRMEQLFSRLIDLCWSPRHGILAACGDGWDPHQRSKDISTVYVYRP